MKNNFFFRFLILAIDIIDYTNKKKIVIFFQRKLKKKPLYIIDIGAHKGETINLFLKHFKIKKILSFEPNTFLFNFLKKKFYNDKIKLFNLGIGSSKASKILNIMLETSSSTINKINYKSKYYKNKKKIISFFSKKNFLKKKQKINMITLSDVIFNNKIKKIDILKIDTEGYEYNVLKGISKVDFKKIRFIYFEHHYDLMIKKKYKFSDINRFLKSHHFKMKYKIKMKFRKTFEYIYEKNK